MRCRTTLLALLAFTVLPEFAMSQTEFPDPEKLSSQPEPPDPLRMRDGTPVTTREQWEKKRRPELKALFQHYMYGQMPPAPRQVQARVLHEDAQALGGKATLREIALLFNGGKAPPLHVLLVVPNERRGPAPVFVGLNFAGNHAAVADPQVQLPTGWMYPNRKGVTKDNRATDAGRGSEVDVWNLDLAVARGYAVALAYNGDIDPDRKERREGLRPYLATLGTTAPAGAETATIAAWAWGLHRMVDLLLGRPGEIDPKRIICVGHSRLGKTALLAAAFDERIALAIPHQAGCGGTAPSRCHNPKAETVKRITTSFPHWFCDNFKKFNDDTSKLPFDQHCLAALVAPRPLLYTNAIEDQWANPDGQFAMLRAAEPVYRLLGAEGLAAKEMPTIGKLVDSRLGYFIRAGKHSMTREDWQVFLDYADKQLGKP
jgi:hypothetical protein